MQVCHGMLCWQVMAANGVSHHVVEDDLAGVEAMLKWLAFVPATLAQEYGSYRARHRVCASEG